MIADRILKLLEQVGQVAAGGTTGGAEPKETYWIVDAGTEQIPVRAGADATEKSVLELVRKFGMAPKVYSVKRVVELPRAVFGVPSGKVQLQGRNESLESSGQEILRQLAKKYGAKRAFDLSSGKPQLVECEA